MRVSLVLDASAVAKWFIEEDESREMRRILRQGATQENSAI